MQLTIAIPTYNRNQILFNNLQLLLPQLTPDCKLLIIDNHSDIPVAETLKEILDNYPNINYEIIRNSVNIGANGNIMRCFELCVTKWLWLLGDDDLVKPNAMETIFAYLKKDEELVFLNFYSVARSHPIRREDIFSEGLLSFLKKIDFLGSVLFISASVFNIDKLRNNLRQGNFMQYSCAPHLVVLLAYLNYSTSKEDKCILSYKQVVDFGVDKTIVFGQKLYPSIAPALGLPLLLDLPFESNARKMLAKQIGKMAKKWITLPNIINFLVHKSYIEGNSKKAFYYYKQVISRFFILDCCLLTFMLKHLGFILILFPKIFVPVLDKIYEISRGKKYDYERYSSDRL